MSAAYDFVFTSGGIGPTHDDLTIDGIAKAFGRAIQVSDSIAARIERAQGGKPNESQLKMARIPEGAQLVDAATSGFPVVIVENVSRLPGHSRAAAQEVRIDSRALPRRARAAPAGLREAAGERHRRPAERSCSASSRS